VLCGVGLAMLPIGPPAAASSTTQRLAPPLPPPLVVLRSFAPPAHRWDAGNRGVDLAAAVGEPVFAGATGRVVYAGPLAGRGVISLDVGSLEDGSLEGVAHLTYEPVDPLVSVGSAVAAGALIGYVSADIDACGPPGSCLHWGVRTGATYLDPLRLLRAPRVRLLPIWSGGVPAAPVAAVLAATPGVDDEPSSPGMRRAS
jgi:murein DD-endopeptidase MepM/ murein hydrolase activator NlpD